MTSLGEAVESYLMGKAGAIGAIEESIRDTEAAELSYTIQQLLFREKLPSDLAREIASIIFDIMVKSVGFIAQASSGNIDFTIGGYLPTSKGRSNIISTDLDLENRREIYLQILKDTLTARIEADSICSLAGFRNPRGPSVCVGDLYDLKRKDMVMQDGSEELIRSILSLSHL